MSNMKLIMERFNRFVNENEGLGYDPDAPAGDPSLYAAAVKQRVGRLVQRALESMANDQGTSIEDEASQLLSQIQQPNQDPIKLLDDYLSPMLAGNSLAQWQKGEHSGAMVVDILKDLASKRNASASNF